MALNQWAHKVRKASTKTSQKTAKKKVHLNVVIKSEADLDAALSKHSQLCAALPGSRDRKVLEHMMKKAPPADELREGEI